jgi:orotidine-5'-phosphate decarboxylase
VTVASVENATGASAGAPAEQAGMGARAGRARAGAPAGQVPTLAESFGDRLSDRVVARRSQLVLGIDPDPARLWPEAIRRADAETSAGADAEEGAGGSPGSDVDIHSDADRSGQAAVFAARAVAIHCALLIEAAGDQCVAVKPQVACFERLGAPGWAALAWTIEFARDHGLLVIADAKRGDVDVTATAYAQAFLGETPTPYGPVRGLDADAVTVNPLLGRDSLQPFVTAARSAGRGLFVLVRTSNPGATDVQEAPLAGGGAVSERLAEMVDELGAGGVGLRGLSDIGAVVGATAPGRLAELRERMPRAPFLLPGVGAQGGKVEELAPAFAPGPAGGLVSASRGIVAAYERLGGDPATAAAREASRLRELAWQLAR